MTVSVTLADGDLFMRPREPEDIMAEALAHRPVAIYVGFSGGDTSLVTAHWMMNNVPGCRVFHANTGIGIERTREFVRERATSASACQTSQETEDRQGIDCDRHLP